MNAALLFIYSVTSKCNLLIQMLVLCNHFFNLEIEFVWKKIKNKTVLEKGLGLKHLGERS